MSRLDQVYKTLLKRFGSQGWWPTTPAGGGLPRYASRPRAGGLSEREKFEICAGAILTQNTAWTNVEKALAALHKADCLTAEKIRRVPFARLASLIRSSGYFRQKAKKLKIFAAYLLKHYRGRAARMLSEPQEKLRAELLEIYGMGPETVDSILLYAGGRPVFVVDAYTRRIGRRLGFFRTEDYAEVQNYFEERLERSAALFNEFHALLVKLGKDFCRSKPLCALCPLLKQCPTGRKQG